MKRSLLFLIACSAIQATVFGQTADKSMYERAVALAWNNVNNKKAFQLYVSAGWFADSTSLWYAQFSKEKKVYFEIALKDGKRKELFDHEIMASRLSEKFKRKFDAKQLDLWNLNVKSRKEFEFSVSGKVLLWNNVSNTLQEKPASTPENEMETVSPDGNWIAYSKDHNLFIRSSKTGEVKQLSTKGKKDYEYASYYGWSDIIEGEGSERPRRFYVNWSPDSKFIETSICDLRGAQKMFLLDWSIDTLYRPKLLSYYRGSPGDTNIVYLTPVVFNVETGKEFIPDIPKVAHENGYSFEWSHHTGIGYFSYLTRGFQQAHFSRFDASSGLNKTLFSDSSKTHVGSYSYRLVDYADVVFFTSERSGWRQLYKLDLKTSQIQSITSGTFYVNDVLFIDEKSKLLYFTASGREAGKTPYQQSLYKVDWNGKNLKLLTPEDGTHDFQLSPDKRYVVDNFSTPTTPTTTVLRELKSGKIITTLSKADVSELIGTTKWQPAQPFSTLASDGKTRIYGLLWKPTNFDASKKYAIIDHSYTGPQSQTVPQTFSRSISIGNHSIAELGFIVIMVDGRGSFGRSKEFHNVSYKRLGFGLEDHITAIRNLSKEYSWIDTTRVGIFGHSAGGYDAAHALLQYPEFYKVGVSSSADHDHRMEKAWWPEMYMGWPVDSAYHKQSNVTMAKNLKGKLLLVHGGIDENVNPSATFKLSEMLIRADKQFDLLILPSQRHGYQGVHQRYFTKTRWNYFVKHLLKIDPLWDFDF